jgi:hypothetical protein
MTGNLILQYLRARLDDEGDDSQDSAGNAVAVKFWGDTELLLLYNMAQQSLFMTLVDLGKLNELKNLTSSATSSPLPAAAYAPYAAEMTIGGTVVHAELIDDPMNGSKLYTARETAVTILGNVINANQGSAFTVYYFIAPTDVAANNTTLTQMTTPFYDACLSLAEYYATHKDLAQSRIIMRRKFGETNLPFVQVTEYLQNAA